MLFGDYFGSAIYISEHHEGLAEVGHHFHGAWAFVEHSFGGPAFYLAALGVFSAWFMYMKRPDLAADWIGLGQGRTFFLGADNFQSLEVITANSHPI